MEEGKPLVDRHQQGGAVLKYNEGGGTVDIYKLYKKR